MGRPVIVLSHPIFLAHDTGPGHPECAARLAGVLAALEAAGVRWQSVAAPAAEAALARAHDADHRARTAALVGAYGLAGEETPIGPRSIEAARWASGAVVEAVDRALAGAAEVWALVRPPGHHATRDRAMGFCIYNHVAVGALHALAAGARGVAVLDWDVHHGNGTQDILWDEPRAAFVSIHQHPLYPDSGAPEERGAHGTILNLPLPSGSDDADYLRELRTRALPALERVDPAVVLVSAGFDAHQGDPLAGMWLTAAGFGALAGALRDWARARGAALVFVLEGGYRLDTLPDCVLAAMGVDPRGREA